jgi:hypothetical protein
MLNVFYEPKYISKLDIGEFWMREKWMCCIACVQFASLYEV